MEIPAEDSRVTMGNQTEKKHRFHLKMPQKGRKHSVKKRIAYTFIATMAATLLIIGLINYFFLGSFYIRDKEHILAESFQKLNATGGDSDDIPDTFEQFCVTNNLKVIITGPELSSFVYSNATDRQSLQTLIFGLISGNEQANTKVVDSKDNYQIQKFYDSHADAEYLQIIGWFDNGNCYFARCPLESITDAVGLSNQFYLFIGIPIIIIGAIVIWIITRQIVRPVQELKGFAKVFLAPGESRTVSIALDDKAFRYWNVKTDRWEVEGGSYQLRVGASSEDIRLKAEVSVKGTNAPDPYEGLDLLHYVSGQITYVTDAEFEALLGHPIPEDVVRIDRNMTLGEMDHGRSPLGWVAQKVLRCRLDSSFAKGTPDLNTVFQYNMPLRALAKMTNGMVSMGMVDGLVWELKGFWLVGILRVIYEFVKNLILNSQMENRLKNS